MPWKYWVDGNLPLVGDDRRIHRKAGSRVVGGRIIIRHRTADRAAIAHMRVADQMCKLGERGDCRLDDRAFGNFGVARHGPDDDRLPLLRDRAQFRQHAYIDDVGGVCETRLQRRDQCLATGHQLGVLAPGQEIDGLAQRRWLVIIEGVHDFGS